MATKKTAKKATRKKPYPRKYLPPPWSVEVSYPLREKGYRDGIFDEAVGRTHDGSGTLLGSGVRDLSWCLLKYEQAVAVQRCLTDLCRAKFKGPGWSVKLTRWS